MNNAGTGPQPADLSDVRAMNLAVVLRHLRSAGPCSRGLAQRATARIRDAGGTPWAHHRCTGTGRHHRHRPHGTRPGPHPVDPSGPKCACGQSGGIEAGAGLETLLTRAGIDPRDVVARDVEVQLLAQRSRDGQAHALSALAEVGAGIGYAVALLVNLLNPTVILLGGHYAALGRWLLPVVERELRPLTAAPDAGGVQLVASTLGYEAAALGGAAVALDTIVSILIDPK